MLLVNVFMSAPGWSGYTHIRMYPCIYVGITVPATAGAPPAVAPPAFCENCTKIGNLLPSKIVRGGGMPTCANDIVLWFVTTTYYGPPTDPPTTHTHSHTLSLRSFGHLIGESCNSLEFFVKPSHSHTNSIRIAITFWPNRSRTIGYFITQFK